jgi:urease accessory protein
MKDCRPMSINEIHEFEINMLQLSDSFFPTGMYSTSSGLETFFYQKRIRNASELQQLLKVYIENQIGPADCVALGNSIDCTRVPNLQMLIKVDQKLFSMKLVKEIRDVSVRSGTQLLKCISMILPDNKILRDYQEAIVQGEASGIYPVALGLTCALFNIPKRKAGLVLIYSFAVSVIGAALRLGMINHFEGQKIVNELKPVMLSTVMKNVDRQLLDMWQFAPEIDTTQIIHEQSERRMFIS